MSSRHAFTSERRALEVCGHHAAILGQRLWAEVRSLCVYVTEDKALELVRLLELVALGGRILASRDVGEQHARPLPRLGEGDRGEPT